MEPPANPDGRGFNDEEAVTTPSGIQKPVIPLVAIFVCAGLSMLFMNTGLLSFFYLAPLGYAVIISSSYIHTFVIAAAAGTVFNVIKLISSSNAGGNIMLDIIYFSVIILSFTWLMGGQKFRTAYRFILASAAGAIISIIFINSPHVKFYEYFHDIAEAVFNNSKEQLLDDGGTRRLLNMRTFSPEQMVEMAKSFILRGGALISMFFLFFVNMQIANFIFSIVKRQRKDFSLIPFIAPVNTIWVLSGAIATILLTSMFKIGFIDIIAWNVLTVCAVVFLAQGAGVLMYWLSLRTPVFRLVNNVLIVVILFSPLNVFAISALVILGVADIWMSFRTPKINA
ncbi:MAG: hypothetical protein FWB95_06585 [Treponema sp.]|nr:hypothetical protein [Treponema sp.]